MFHSRSSSADIAGTTNKKEKGLKQDQSNQDNKYMEQKSWSSISDASVQNL